jgi:membrane protein YdbS with pleckstrin-like domain
MIVLKKLTLVLLGIIKYNLFHHYKYHFKEDRLFIIHGLLSVKFSIYTVLLIQNINSGGVGIAAVSKNEYIQPD